VSLPPTRVTGVTPGGVPSVDPFAARIGEVLGGKWLLEELLGVGGMAAVYAARHRVAENRVAVKILHPEVARVDEARQRFEQEAQAVARLGHPGVVEIYDVDVSERGESFLVMERLRGESVATRRSRGQVGVEELLWIIDQTLEVLVAAHGMGIIHRDIKPDNLFLVEGGRLKVLDFGIARVRHASAMRVRTATGAALGTVSYAPPAQLTGGGADHRADIYAVGATMFELAAGRAIHSATNEQQLLVKMMTEPAPPLCQVAPAIPPAIGSIVDRALAFSADDRYPDAATMLGDVRAVREGLPPPFASQAGPATPTAVAAATSPDLGPDRPVAAMTVAPAPTQSAGSRTILAVVLASILGGALLVLLVAFAFGDDESATADDAPRRARETDVEDRDETDEAADETGGDDEIDGARTENKPASRSKYESEQEREARKKAEERAREARKKAEEREREARKKEKEKRKDRKKRGR